MTDAVTAVPPAFSAAARETEAAQARNVEARTAQTAATQAAQQGAPAAASAGGGSGTLNADFQTFLRMLTVQMQNQDPLNPMDPTDFAVQLATFSQVEQQVIANDLLTGLGAQIGALSVGQLAGWVGMDALIDGQAQFSGEPLDLSVVPHPDADRSELIVRDADDEIVQRIPIDPEETGPVWAGAQDDGTPFAEGRYRFEVEHFADGESLVTEPVGVYMRVTEARLDAGQSILGLEGGLYIPASGVIALREG